MTTVIEVSDDSSRCGNHSGWNGQRSGMPGISLTTQRLEKTERATAPKVCLRPHRVDEIDVETMGKIEETKCTTF